MIFTSITRALMASLALFSTVSKLKKSATDVFTQKKFLEDIFNSKIFNRYDQLVIGPRVVQFKE